MTELPKSYLLRVAYNDITKLVYVTLPNQKMIWYPVANGWGDSADEMASRIRWRCQTAAAALDRRFNSGGTIMEFSKSELLRIYDGYCHLTSTNPGCF